MLLMAQPVASSSIARFGLPFAEPPGTDTWLLGTVGAFARQRDWHHASQGMHFGSLWRPRRRHRRRQGAQGRCAEQAAQLVDRPSKRLRLALC